MLNRLLPATRPNEFFTRTQEPYAFLLERREWLAKRLIILTRDNHCCQRCGKTYGANVTLNVHHKHYIYGLDPWEYKDSELITYCEECHSHIHRTSHVPLYRLIDGNLVEVHYTPCYRCGGAGRFPEYNHVQNGICFRCHGARYEEFISVVKSYATEKNIKLEEIDDGFKPLNSTINNLGGIAKAEVHQSIKKGGLYITIAFNNGRIVNCCLDYSVKAKEGDNLVPSSLRYRKEKKRDGQEYVIIKGNLIGYE